MTALAPLTDITNLRRVQSNIQSGCQPQSSLSPLMSRSSLESTALSPEAISPMSVVQNMSFNMPSPPQPTSTGTYRHDPYNWKCLPESDQQAHMLLAQRASHFAATQRQRKSAMHMQTIQRASTTPSTTEAPAEVTPHVASAAVAANPTLTQCRILVQFKCHHGEFSSSVTVEKGQYVVVQGDRGMDIGVVIRVNTDGQKTYIERTGPCGNVLRHATQREVDYWASELKADEQAALDFCKHRVVANDLNMEVRHAEYQFDKKKLTFYYDAKSRVDFVTLLKELYREFGCRIWMEKVRAQE